MEKPQIGEIYRHFKGHYYKVYGFAIDSETQKELIIYRELRYGGTFWARPLNMFMDIHPEHKVKRFEKVNATK